MWRKREGEEKNYNKKGKDPAGGNGGELKRGTRACVSPSCKTEQYPCQAPSAAAFTELPTRLKEENAEM